MKKRIAFILALILFIVQIPSISLVNSYAAGESGFVYRWNSTLSLTDDLKLDKNDGTKASEIFVEWDFQKINGGIYNTVDFNLLYHLENMKDTQVIVNKLGDYARVTYKVTSPQALNNGNFIDLKGIRVYSVTDSKYVTPNLIAPNENYQVLDWRVDWEANPGNLAYRPWSTAPTGADRVSQVSFLIKIDTGFSFIVDNKDVKFKWVSSEPSNPGSGERFYFQTSGADPTAKIYDFSLTSGRLGLDKKMNVVTGIGNTAIDSIPFDAAQPTYTADNLDYLTMTNGVREYIKTGYIVNQLTDALNPSTKDPADKPGIYLLIDYPAEWDKGTHTFKKQYKQPGVDTPDGTDDTPYEATNIFISTGRMTVVIDDIYNPDASDVIKAKRSDKDYVVNSGISANVVRTASGDFDKIRVKISDLEAGIIYYPTDTSVTRQMPPGVTIQPGELPPPVFGSRVITLPLNKVYTFPKFKVVSFGPDDFRMEIQPFKYSTSQAKKGGYYRVYSGYVDNQLTKWADVQDTKGTDLIYVPLGLSIYNNLSAGIKWFKVDFSPNPIADITENLVGSQKLGYAPDRTKVDLGLPQNLKVIPNSVKVVQDENNKEFLMFRAEWDIGRWDIVKDIINNRQITQLEYWFKRGYSPSDPFDVNNSSFAKVTIKNLVPSASPDFNNFEITSETIDYSGNNLSTMAQVVTGRGNSGFTMIYDGTIEADVLHAYATFKLPVFDKNTENTPNPVPFFNYANSYYITTFGRYLKYPTDPNKTEWYNTLQAVPASLSVNGLEQLEVPIPQNVKAILNADDPRTRIEVRFDPMASIRYEDYIKYMLNPKKLTMADNGESVSYNIYMTQSLSSMEKLLKTSGNTDKIATASAEDKDLFEMKDMLATYTNRATSVSAINIGENGAKIDGTNISVKDYLRNNGAGDKVVRIANLNQSAINTSTDLLSLFEGLDKNQAYYFAVETVFTPTGITIGADGEILSDGVFKTDQKRISKLSSAVSETTKNDEEEPEDKEIEPPAPTGLDKKDVTLNQATVFWDTMKDLSSTEMNKIGYEVIRVSDDLLSKDIINSKTKYSDTFDLIKKNHPTKDMVGWKINGLNTFAYQYDEPTKEFKDKTSEGYYEYNLTSMQHLLKDKSLRPNKLYFYYVRSVKLDSSGNPLSYSVWIPVTVTTSTVKGPINLEELREATRDPKKEVVIGFDAPVDLNMVGMDTDYKFEYSIKIDGEDWQEPVEMPKSALTITKSDVKDHTHYVYKITGLKPGTSYSIRVRMVDKTVNDASPYSNIIHTRTTADQDDYDTDKDSEKWMDELKKYLDELSKTPYWKKTVSTNNFEAIYRSEMFDAVMAQNTGSSLVLGVGSGMDQSYYIPSQVLLKAIENNLTFTVIEDNITVNIPANSFNIDSTEAITNISAKIKDRSIKDYFIKINIHQNKVSEYIDGNPPQSNRLTMSFQAVGSTIENKVFDEDVETILMKLVVDKINSTTISDRIKKMIQDKVAPTEMIKYLEEIVSSVEREFSDKVNSKYNSVTRYSYEITSLDKQILVSAKVNSEDNISAYKRMNNEWIILDTINVSDKKGFYTNTPGMYIFAGMEIIIPGIENVENGAIIKTLVAKYNMDDFFGKGNNFNLDANCTSADIIGITARIAGAQRGADYAKWWSNKGISISGRNYQMPVKNQEAVYFIMNMYELRTGTKIASVKITNFKATSDLIIDEKYKQSVRVADQIGLITANKMNPKGELKVREFLDIMTKLSAKIKL